MYDSDGRRESAERIHELSEGSDESGEPCVCSSTAVKNGDSKYRSFECMRRTYLGVASYHLLCTWHVCK